MHPIDDIGGFQAYKTYLAVKQHFTKPNYDFFVYGGEVTAKRESYENRKDRYFFYKIGNKYSGDDLIYYFVANLSENPKAWIGKLCDDESRLRYAAMRKRIDSIEYTFKEDCEKLLDKATKAGLKFNDMFVTSGNKHPFIVKAVLQNTISIETYIIIDELVHFSEHLNKFLDEPLVYGRLKWRCDKYKPFVRFDMNRCKTILKKTVLDYDCVDNPT